MDFVAILGMPPIFFSQRVGDRSYAFFCAGVLPMMGGDPDPIRGIALAEPEYEKYRHIYVVARRDPDGLTAGSVTAISREEYMELWEKNTYCPHVRQQVYFFTIPEGEDGKRYLLYESGHVYKLSVMFWTDDVQNGSENCSGAFLYGE